MYYNYIIHVCKNYKHQTYIIIVMKPSRTCCKTTCQSYCQHREIASQLRPALRN